LVFIKGNKTVDELVQVLQNSVDNGSIQMIPVERPTLRLVLPTTSAPPTTVQGKPPAVAAQRKSLASWIIALLAAIGGLVLLVLVCAIIHCCVRKEKKSGKQEICQRYEDGKWIDLPHYTNGKGSGEPAHAYTGPGAYVEEGPSARGPAHQGNGFYERTPDEVQFSGQTPAQGNGNTMAI